MFVGRQPGNQRAHIKKRIEPEEAERRMREETETALRKKVAVAYSCIPY